MTTPTQDERQRARELLFKIGAFLWDGANPSAAPEYSDYDVNEIAHALMESRLAERTRCAGIAETAEVANANQTAHMKRAAFDAASIIAAAIMEE